MLAGLLVLALGQRVDRADLGAAALQPLEATVDLGALLVAQRPLGRADLLAEPLGDRGQLLGRLGPPVAEVGRLDLDLGQRVGGGCDRSLQLCLPLGAGPHLLGDLVTVALAADDLALGPLDPGPDRGLGGRDRRSRGVDLSKQFLACRHPGAHRLAVAFAKQPLGPAGVTGGSLGAGLHRSQGGFSRRLGGIGVTCSGESLRRRGEADLDLAELLFELAGSLGRGPLGASDVERQRPQLGPQRLEAPLQLGGAVGEARGAHRDPLLAGPQLGQQSPGEGALAIPRGEALLGRRGGGR